MSALEENILAPIAGDDPCGPDLEYDAAFAAFDRARQRKPEQQIGTTIVPAQEPEWKDVKREATALLARSKDLRAACSLTEALLATQGLPGFAEGLSAVRVLVETYWAGLHPRLDPDDGNDPTMRVNIIAGLTEPAVLTIARTVPLVSSRAVGRFSLKDVEIAGGEAPAAPGAEPPTMVTIEAAMSDCDLAELEQTTAAARTCLTALASIDVFLNEELGVEHAPALGKLVALLKKASTFLNAGLARRKPVAAEEGQGDMEGGGTRAPAALSGEISSRDDVMRALDKICRYYATHEPSSPLPILLERCQRLVSMNFVDIVRDLVPGAVQQVELLQGKAK